MTACRHHRHPGPILAVTGQPAPLGGPRPQISYWENLVRDIRAAGVQQVVRRALPR